MDSTGSSIPNLNPDALFHLAGNNPAVWPELLTANKITQQIVLKCFSEANSQAMEAIPSLIELRNVNLPDDNAYKVFVRIIKHLHTEAKRLNCDQSYSRDPAFNNIDHEEITDKIDSLVAWECVHYSDLVKNVQDHTKKYKEEAFSTFVNTVAASIGIVIPEGMNIREFWGFLQEHEQFQQITDLNLASKKMKFLPPEIGSLSNLKELHLNLNQLKELPPELGQLSQLKELDLNSNQIQELPPQISSLSELVSLNVNSNKLSELPEALSSLSNLRHLRAKKNHLKELPPTLTKLSNLEYLDLSENPLDKFPEEISSFEDLTNLHLNNVNLKEIPSELTALQNLKILSLGNNKLEEIDPEIVSSLPNLEELFLRKNPLNGKTVVKLEEMNIPFRRTIELDSSPALEQHI